MMSDRFAAITAVVTVAVLFVRLGSRLLPSMLTEFTICPPTVGVTTSVTVALALTFNVPRVHVIVLIPLQVP